MNTDQFTVEDILMMLAGIDKGYGRFTIPVDDRGVLVSIAKQVANKVALTERQLVLVHERLSRRVYVEQLIKAGLTSEQYQTAIATTYYPVREVDRSRSITVINTLEHEEIERRVLDRMSKNHKNATWIKIAFPFNKRLIGLVDGLVDASGTNAYMHESGTREHFFRFHDNIAFLCVAMLKDEGFEIDSELLEYYEKLEQIRDNKEKYLPYAKDGRVENLHPSAQDILTEKLGAPCVDNFFRYKDRSLMYGIEYFDEELLAQSMTGCTMLTRKIVNRTSPEVLVVPKDFSIGQIVESMVQLERLPMLFILGPENAESDLRRVHDRVKDHVSSEEISVLFRMDNDKNPGFNEFVKNQNLNSPVTENTKVVFVSRDKMPKPLLQSGWLPDSVVRVGSNRLQLKVGLWTHECDLIVHYDTVASPWLGGQIASNRKKRKVETI